MHPQEIYGSITNQIIELMESHGSNWTKPWTSVSGIPKNHLTRIPYRGINNIMLSLKASQNGYSSSLWATYKQWQLMGANVMKGQKGTLGIFYQPVEIEEDGVAKTIPMVRHFYVFNYQQTEGLDLDPEIPLSENQRDEELTKFITGTGATIKEGGNIACYRKDMDLIEIPSIHAFETSELYYINLMHELGHWTGHPSRLDRAKGLSSRFGSEAYAFEELVAELCSCYLAVQLGLTHEPQPHTAKYLNNWLAVLSEDSKAFVKASSLAQQATDFLLNHQTSNATV